VPLWFSRPISSALTVEADERLQSWKNAVKEIENAVVSHKHKLAFDKIKKLTRLQQSVPQVKSLVLEGDRTIDDANEVNKFMAEKYRDLFKANEDETMEQRDQKYENGFLSLEIIE